MASDPFASLYAVDPFASLYGGEEEAEEERLRREARERIQRNLRIGAEQAARLDLPEKGQSTIGEAVEATLWGDLGGGLADLGALPGNLGNIPPPEQKPTAANPLPQLPGLMGSGPQPNALALLPESYRQKSAEVSELAERGRSRADTARQEAGMSPTISALTGVVAENPDLIAGVGAAGRGVARAGLRQLDDLGRLVEEGVERGVREGAEPLGRAVGAPPTPALPVGTRLGPGIRTEAIRSRLDELGSGKPGLDELAESEARSTMVYRDPEGNPVAFVDVTRDGDRIVVDNLAADPSRGNLGKLGAGRLLRELSSRGELAAEGAVSPDAARLLGRRMPSGRTESPSPASAASALPVEASRPVDASEAVLRVSAQGRSVMERAARPALTPGAERAAFDAESGGVGSAALTGWLRKNVSFKEFPEYLAVADGFVDPRVKKYIGETLPRRVEMMGNEERLMLREMQLLSREIDQVTAQVAKASGGQVSPAQLRRQMDAARRSGDYTALRDRELEAVAQKAGSFLDNLSQQYIDLGVVDEGMADTFRSNMGRYMHTSHAAFDRPGFLEEVRGTKAWDEARAFVKSEIPDATEDEVVGLLESLADRKQPRPLGFGKKSGLGRKDLTNLIQKEEIPEPIRELLGVYKDYRVNFERGTAKMAHTIAEHRLLRDVAEELESMGVLRQPSPTTGKGEAGFYRQISGGPERSPIEGYYTTPQVADLLQGVLEQSRSTWYSYLSGAVKFFKVAASPQTQLRNWESGFLMSMANGNFVANPRHLVRTAQVQKALVTQVPGGTESRMLKFLGAADAVELEADIGKAIELGVIQRSAQGKEFASYVEEIGQGPQGLRRIVENKPVGYLSRAYMAGDDFWKFANWKAEMDKLGWAYSGQAPRDALEREAAEIVSQQLQTYDRVMPLARKLSRNPLVGPFATFHLEMPRNLVNIFRRSGTEYMRAKQALAAGDTAAAARWTAVATQRMAGVGAALTMFGAYKTYVNKKNGITGDKEEAFRRLALPPYAENSQAVVVEVDGDDVTYFDSQFADPYNIVQRLWVAAIARPGDPAERTMRAAEELGRTFLGPELLTSTVVGQVANQDLSTGRPITYDSRPPERQIMDRAEHAWRGLAPGGAITAERLGRAAAGQEPYDLGREAVAVVGPRWRTTNVRESFGFKVGDFNEARRRISTDYNAQSTNRDGTPKGAEEVQAALAEAERSWKRSYGEMQEYVTDLKNWGLSDSEVYKELTGRKVRADLARKLVSGQFMDYGTYRRSIN